MYSPLRTVCEANGIRVTTVRKAIFELLEATSPISVSAFFDLTQQKGYDKVSVYRTLNLFRKLGLIDEFGIGNQRIIQARIDQDEHHHFIRCENCKLTKEFEDDSIEYQITNIAAENGFLKVRSHYLEIIGLCQSCQN